jgi:hypothetical protein
MIADMVSALLMICAVNLCALGFIGRLDISSTKAPAPIANFTIGFGCLLAAAAGMIYLAARLPL